MTVDPKVFALAEGFVDDTLKPFNRGDDVFSQAQRQAWIQQCAEAVQHVLELECQTLETYLEAERDTMRSMHGSESHS